MNNIDFITKANNFLSEHTDVVPVSLNSTFTQMDHTATRARFLDMLHAGNDGVIFLPRKKFWNNPEDSVYIDKNGTKRNKPPFSNNVWFDLSSKDDPDNLIWADTNDSYVSGNPMDGGENERGQKIRDEHHCLGINEMHLDIDVLHGLVPYDQHLADQIIAIVISILLRELPKPTIIVLSGRGLTWIYRYDHLIPNPTTQEIRGKRKIVSHLNPDVFTHDSVYKMLIQKVQSLFDPAIIEIDSRITDHARILRMPGTINRKAGRYATIFDCDPACRYAPEQLYEYFNIFPAYPVHDDVVINEPKKSTVKKKKASKSLSTSHERNTENDNIVLYAPVKFRWAAKSRIPKMMGIPNMIAMYDGMGRKKLVFALYCHARILYTRDVAYSMAKSLNEHFAEPLDDAEFENQILRVDQHQERPGWHIHADGTYIFNAATLEENFIPECAMGMFTADAIRRAEYKKNQDEAAERDREIAKLWLSGMSALKISRALAGKYHHISQDTIKRTVKRLGLTAERNTTLETIDFDEKKRYGHKKKQHSPAEILQLPDSNEGATLHESRERDDATRGVEEQTAALSFLLTGKNAFLTGAAGTGKTHVLQEFLTICRTNGKTVTVVASSGIAAENLGGNTINHGLRVPVQTIYLPDSITFDVSALRRTDVLVIDEISMVRVDLFGCILQLVHMAEQKYNRHIQIVACGDYHQIAPIVTNAERDQLQPYKTSLGSLYAFASVCGWEDCIWQNTIELHHVWRQNNRSYCTALDQLAVGNYNGIEYFNKNAHIGLSDAELSARLENGYVYLSAFRLDVQRINTMMIARHQNDTTYRTWTYSSIVGTTTATFPVDKTMPVYEGMPVMFIKNGARYCNGTRGIIKKICSKFVQVIVNNEILHVYPAKIPATDNSHSIMTQLPFVPCYAMTIHKSQGLTLDRVILNPTCFESGQLYTALSRIKNINDLTLTVPIQITSLRVDAAVLEFYQKTKTSEIAV